MALASELQRVRTRLTAALDDFRRGRSLALEHFGPTARAFEVLRRARAAERAYLAWRRAVELSGAVEKPVGKGLHTVGAAAREDYDRPYKHLDDVELRSRKLNLRAGRLLARLEKIR